MEAQGRIWVLETGVREIRGYSPAGELVARMGRAGEGPGEFSERGSLTFGVRGDTVWAYDMTIQRFTLFDREGGLQSARRIEEV